jgi:cation:H+ antiporter
MITGPVPPEEAQRAATQAIWTFPSILSSAFVVAWGAEAAQFHVSQGLALALLAWIQVLPEFAVEAVISWHRDVPLMTANFTGALRLLTGLGWPTIWVMYALSRRRKGNKTERWPTIHLEEEHCAEVVGLIPPLVYFAWIIYKGTLDCVDAGVLIVLYLLYLVVLNRIPPKDHEEIEDVAAIPRAVLGLPAMKRRLAIVGLFLLGSIGIYFTAHPFLNSMIGLATVLGISQFVFIQWVAPLLSELPEFTTTSYWSSRGKAPMALMNMVSSNMNQWTVLAAMIPIVYSLSLGHPAAVPIAEHRVELMLTLLQGALGTVLLANLEFHPHEALGLFGLWFVQLLVPHWREEVSALYGLWLAFEIAAATRRPGGFKAFPAFARLWRRERKRSPRRH